MKHICKAQYLNIGPEVALFRFGILAAIRTPEKEHLTAALRANAERLAFGFFGFFVFGGFFFEIENHPTVIR